MDIDDNLKQLIHDWFKRRDREKSINEFWEKPRLPEWLLKRITVYEPFRAQAIADAEIHWAAPGWLGFGMELFFPEQIEIASFEHWKQTVYQLKFQFGSGMYMDGTDWEKHGQEIERVGIENGEWRIIEVLNEEKRKEMRWQFEIAKKFYAEKYKENQPEEIKYGDYYDSKRRKN